MSNYQQIDSNTDGNFDLYRWRFEDKWLCDSTARNLFMSGFFVRRVPDNGAGVFVIETSASEGLTKTVINAVDSGKTEDEINELIQDLDMEERWKVEELVEFPAKDVREALECVRDAVYYDDAGYYLPDRELTPTDIRLIREAFELRKMQPFDTRKKQ